jgi:hypothetical protein
VIWVEFVYMLAYGLLNCAVSLNMCRKSWDEELVISPGLAKQFAAM